MDETTRGVLLFVGGIAVAGGVFLVVKHLAARSAQPSSKEVKSGSASHVGAASYYEHQLAKARREQDRMAGRAHDQQFSWRDKLTADVQAQERRQAHYANVAERAGHGQENAEQRAAHAAGRAASYGDPLEVTAVDDDGSVRHGYVGAAEDDDEVKAAREALRSAKQESRSSTQEFKGARAGVNEARHDWRSEHTGHWYIPGRAVPTNGARTERRDAHKVVISSRQKIKAASQDVHKERAERRAGRRQGEAEEINRSIDTPLTDFQPDRINFYGDGR